MNPTDKQLARQLSTKLDELMDRYSELEEQLEGMPPSMSDSRRALENQLRELNEFMSAVEFVLSHLSH